LEESVAAFDARIEAAIAAPFCLVGREYQRAYNRERRSPTSPLDPRENARPRSRISLLPGPSSAHRGIMAVHRRAWPAPASRHEERHQAEAIPHEICPALAISAESLIRGPIVSSASTRQLTGLGRSCALPEDVSSAGLRTRPAIAALQPTSP
jgi:hypothetical protein